MNESSDGSCDLTDLDPDIQPFWNEATQQWSRGIPLVPENEYRESSSDSWTGSLKRLTHHSWFTVKKKVPPPIGQEPCSAPSRSLWQDIADRVVQKKQHLLDHPTQPRSRKHRTPTETTKPPKKRKLTEKQEAKKQQKLEEKKKKREEKQLKRKLAIEHLEEHGRGRAGKRIKVVSKTKPVVDGHGAQPETKVKEEKAPEKPSPSISCDTVRLYPTKQQRRTLTEWFGCARWSYNRAVDTFQKFGPTANKLSYYRQTIVNESLHVGGDTEWVLKTPTEVRTEAVRDCQKAISINLKLASKDKTRTFEMKFKSVKAASDSIVISAKRRQAEVNLLNRMHSEKGKVGRLVTWERDMRLVRKKSGNYYLCIPREMKPVSESQAPPVHHPTDSISAGDPGVRTFMTVYDTNGNVFEWGKDDVQALCRLKHHSEKLQARIKNDRSIHHKQRYRMQRALCRLNDRIRCLVSELHRKLAKWWCENYRVIFLPKFEVSGMVRKAGGRKLRKKTVRGLLALKHYAFRRCLLNKAREYPWVRVYLVNEAYTSKTCTGCGWIDRDLGGKKTFDCRRCRLRLARDTNGSRNIMLRQFGMLFEADGSSEAAAEGRSLPLLASGTR